MNLPTLSREWSRSLVRVKRSENPADIEEHAATHDTVPPPDLPIADGQHPARAHALRVIDRLYRWALWCAYHALCASRRIRRTPIHGAYVAVWSGDRVLLIQNSYRAGDTFPAGGLKRGETHREAARRELAEEVGIEVRPDELEFVCEVEIESRYGLDRCHFFELHLDEDPEVRIDRREVVAWNFCPAEELLERPLLRIVRSYLNQRRTPPHLAQ